MDELVKLVAEKTGIPEAQAKVAVKTVLDFLKKKLPAPMGSQLENLLDSEGGITDLAAGISNLFDK